MITIECGCYYGGYDYNDELCARCLGLGELSQSVVNTLGLKHELESWRKAQFGAGLEYGKGYDKAYEDFMYLLERHTIE